MPVLPQSQPKEQELIEIMAFDEFRPECVELDWTTKFAAASANVHV